MRILVVDDDRAVQEMLVDLLQEAGYDVGIRSVRLASSIRRIGEHHVAIQFDKDLRTEVTVNILPDEPFEDEQPEDEADEEQEYEEEDYEDDEDEWEEEEEEYEDDDEVRTLYPLVEVYENDIGFSFI